MAEVKTQFSTKNRKKHCFLPAAILLFIGKIIITLASLSHLEALCLNVTSDALNNAYSKIKKAKSIVG